MKKKNRFILYLIVFTGAVLRFINYDTIPFTHDEFSALFRLNFNSFSELIEKGVKVDGHPAGVHIFLYYWTRIFGNSEWIVKLPFTILGIFSIVLIYKIAQKWYNETVALISAAYLASVQYAIVYSQIARPYGSGLFFSLLMVYYWTLLIKEPQRNFNKHLILFALAASLCSYNHYFSLLFAGIVGLSGLFFIPRNHLLKYIASGGLIFVLYIPHLKLFFHHFEVGGLDTTNQWIPEPQNDFLIIYLKYIFNYSLLSICIALGIIVYGLKEVRKFNFELNQSLKPYLLFGLWFLLPFSIGFLYSIYRNPVLQYSVLIFSFPFLFFVLFGHIKSQKRMVNLILIIAILLSNTTSLVLKRKHYDLFYQSVFKEIWLNYKEVNQRYPNKVLSIIDSHSKISEYYIHKYKTGTAFTHLSSFKTSYELKEFIVQNLHHDYLYLGHLSSNDPITVPLIQAYYPTIEWQKNYSGGNSFLFSKTPKRTEEHIVSFLNFETQSNPFWGNIEPANIIDSLSFNGECYYTIDSLQEWGPTFIKPLDSIILNPNNFIDISLKVKSPSKIEDVLLAATLETPDTTFYWSSASSNTQIAPSSNNEQWFNLYHSVKLSDICLNYDAIKLKVFVWNKGKKLIYIDDFKISLRKGNPLLYGLSEDFEE